MQTDIIAYLIIYRAVVWCPPCWSSWWLVAAIGGVVLGGWWWCPPCWSSWWLVAAIGGVVLGGWWCPPCWSSWWLVAAIGGVVLGGWWCPPCWSSWWLVAAIGGVVLGGWWCPPCWSSWWLPSVEWSSVAGGVLPGGSRGGWGCPPWCPPAYSQPDTRAGARKAPQCGGALACESTLQGKFAGCDCSNYQLFRFSFRDGFYRLAFLLSL